MSRLTSYKKYLFPLFLALLVITPAITQAATFDNPLGGTYDIREIIKRLILWVIGLSGFLALLALVVGGAMLTIGGFDNEQQAARAKKIITWAVIGILVVGTASTMLYLTRLIIFAY